MGTPDKLGPYLAGILAAIVVFLAFNIRSARHHRSLPPGPKALPLIGNLLDIPSSEEWLTWQAYVERYGDLVYLTALGSNYLLLGSYKSIVDLLEKRPHFNHRPRPTMLCDLMDFEWILTFVPYGLTWRRGRRIIHSQAHVHAAKAYESVQLRGARRFVCDLLASEATRSADKLSEAAKAILPHVVRRNFAFTAVHMIYGIDVHDPITEARYVDLPEAVLHASSEGASPGRFLVDLIPLLKHVPSWFPGAHFKRFAAESAAMGRQMRDEPIVFVKAQIAAGIAPQSMAAHMLKAFPRDEELVKDIAAVTYLAGSDTVVAAVTSYFLAMVVDPSIQERAQEELNRVVGRERFPEFADKDKLPYLESVMRECLRWLPVIPNGVAHVTGQDDEYRGYFIPKGTIVLPLHWCLLRDPEIYPNPSIFSPERYLTRQGDGAWKLREDVVDPRTYAFGFGRRVCPGKNIAEQGLFATLSTVIHTLNVGRAKDADGQEVIPEAQMTSGMLCHPRPFAYELRMRDDAKHLVDMCTAAVEQ